MKKMPLISLIIPTYNSESVLPKCLQSIKEQSYPFYEVIVVDQKSADQTVSIAKAYKAKVISTKKPKFYSPPSKSRNIGAKKARGVYLYHMDSDMRLSKNILQEAVTIFKKNKKIGALMVHEEDKTKGFFSKCKALERFCYRGNDEIDSARIVRKNIFVKVGGYDETISSGEDFAIQQKYKKVSQVAYCKNTIDHDLTSLTFFSLLRKKFNYGKTADTYFQKSNKSGVHILFSQVSQYAKNYKLLATHPLLTTGMIFLKVSELFSGYAGYMLAKYYES